MARASQTHGQSDDLYLRALPAWFGQTEVEYKRTQALLSKAIDPEHAEALGTLIDSVDTRTSRGRHESWTRGVNGRQL